MIANTKSKKVSRRDVAKAAGVSLTTVTHALAGTPGTRVRKETVELVKRVAAEMDYRPNFIGHALRTGRNCIIGVLQPEPSSIQYSYYQDMYIGLSEAMEPDDYNMLMLFREKDFSYMRVIDQGRVDGMVIIQSDLDNSHVDKIAASGIPTVVINKLVDTGKFPNLACVCPDYDKFVHDLVEDFKDAGCKSILAIHNYVRDDANVNMYNAFNETLKKHAASGITGATIIPDCDNFKIQCLNIFKSGQHWDGIFIDNSSFANILIEAASECGIEAGKDFILITTNTRMNMFTRKRLEYSFYSQQGQQMGREAWRLLSSMLNNDIENKTVLVPYFRQLVNNSMKRS